MFHRLLRRIRTRPDSDAEADRRRVIDVLERRISVIDEGTGDPAVFVQGSIASASSWNRVLPYLTPHARCIAVDLLGTGESERIVPSGDDTYSLPAQRTYFETLMESLDLEGPVTLVVQGWGSMVALDWAARHPASIKALCHMEAILRPLRRTVLTPEVLDEMDLARSIQGVEFVLGSEEYLEHALQEHVAYPLPASRVAEYRRSFGADENARRAVLTAIREIPLDGRPDYSQRTVQHYWEWLLRSGIPKLAIFGEPGYLNVGRLRKELTDLPNQITVSVVGSHLLQEDSPDGVGTFLSAWYRQQVMLR